MTAARPSARWLSPLVAAGLAAALGGCISVLPKDKPVQLYRFGGDRVPGTQPAASPGPRFPVLQLTLGFDRAAATDRILTITGDQAAYVSTARWVTTAPALFETAVNHAFDGDSGPARLIARGEAVQPDYLLKLDVRTFEARYDNGQAAPPTAVVEVYAAMSKPGGRGLAGERIFLGSATADENTQGGIARAFDKAVSQALGALVPWVDARGGTAAAAG